MSDITVIFDNQSIEVGFDNNSIEVDIIEQNLNANFSEVAPGNLSALLPIYKSCIAGDNHVVLNPSVPSYQIISASVEGKCGFRIVPGSKLPDGFTVNCDDDCEFSCFIKIL
jgi:hypothetical protein